MRAYNLRIEGKSLYEIAEDLDIKSVQEVIALLEARFNYDAAYLTDTERESILALELARCDQLQTAFWEQSMMGDVGSARVVLDIMKHRAKISGMEQVDPVVQKNLVLIMGDQEADYIEALKATQE